MSHEVETMMYKGEKPWHGLGTEIDGATTFWEAFRQAGLDWEVETEPIYRIKGYTEEGAPQFETIDKGQVSVRQSDQRVLGVVGPKWHPLQNRDAFGVFEPLVESGELEIETAGSLRNGERIWALCRLSNMDPSDILAGDPVNLYALLSNGHDGKLAVHFGLTPIRVVCANTEAMARGDKASKLIRVRHGRFVKENVEALRDVMDTAKGEFAATCEQYEFLASRQINSADLNKYVRICLDLELDDDKIKTRSKNILDRVIELHDTGLGSDIPGVRGSYWGAYNSVTEYFSHVKGRSEETRIDSLWFGPTKTKNHEALKVALAMAS